MSDKKNIDWFSFYPNKFYFGTMGMQDHEVGRYIRLMCEQWFNGHITPDFTGMPDEIEIVGTIISVKDINNSEQKSDGLPNGSPNGNPDGLAMGTHMGKNGYPSDPSPQKIRIRLDKAAMWESLKSKYVEIADGKFAQANLEKERGITLQKIDSKLTKAEIGRKFALKRWGKSDGLPNGSPNGNPDGLAMGTHIDTYKKSDGLPNGDPHGDLMPITLHYINKDLDKEPDGKSEGNVNENDSLETEKNPEKKIAPKKFLIREVGEIELVLPDPKLEPEVKEVLGGLGINQLLITRLSTGSKSFQQHAIRQALISLFISNPQFRYAGQLLKDLNYHLSPGKIQTLEREFNKLALTPDKFLLDFEKVKSTQTPEAGKSFLEYYMKKMESGSYYFQTLNNPVVADLFKDWKSSRSKVGQAKTNGKAEMSQEDISKMSEEDQMKYYS